MTITDHPAIDLDAVRAAGQVIPIQQALDVLATTEPMDSYDFALDTSNSVKFTIPLGWQDDEMRAKPGHTVTDCTVSLNDADPLRLTKEALLKMTSSIGLTKDYVLRTPGPLITPQLNWWVRNNGVKSADGMRLLAKDGVGVAFIKDSLTSFPNLPLVHRMLERVRDRYETEELWADFKINHSLERTALRVIIPNTGRLIESARHTSDREDRWSLGLQFTNSLMADPETRLNVSGYLFSWWCSNGAISTHASSGNYNRRVQGQDEAEVLDWIGSSVDAIFADLDTELDEVANLTQVSLDGELSDVITDVFKQFKVPVPARKSVLDALVDSDDLTGYGLMQAITQAANDPHLSDHVRENTMRVGGLIPHTITDRCTSCHRVILG